MELFALCSVQKRNARDLELGQQQEPVSEGEKVGEHEKCISKKTPKYTAVTAADSSDSQRGVRHISPGLYIGNSM